MHNNSYALRARTLIEQTRNSILDPFLLPYTHQTLNIALLLKQNEQFLDKLNSEFFKLSAKSVAMGENSKRRLSNHLSKSITKISVPKPIAQNHTLKLRNQYLRKQIQRVRESQAQQQISQNPSLQQKQSQITDITQLISSLSEKNAMLKQVIQSNKGDLFEMYDKMCRKCEKIRKVNDLLSEQIKSIIVKTNELTGQDENPNLFIMHFK